MRVPEAKNSNGNFEVMGLSENGLVLGPMEIEPYMPVRLDKHLWKHVVSKHENNKKKMNGSSVSKGGDMPNEKKLKSIDKKIAVNEKWMKEELYVDLKVAKKEKNKKKIEKINKDITWAVNRIKELKELRKKAEKSDAPKESKPAKESKKEKPVTIMLEFA